MQMIWLEIISVYTSHTVVVLCRGAKEEERKGFFNFVIDQMFGGHPESD